MQISFEEILNLIRFPLLIIGFFAFGIWYLIDTFRIYRFEGKIKRGVKVWSRELTIEEWQFLLSLKQDIVVEKKELFSTYKSDFIRLHDKEILIYSSPKRLSSTWVCIGYVDLNSPLRKLEYRMSLPGIIFLLPFTIIGVGILLFAISFYFYKKSVDTFIEKKKSEFGLRSATFKPSNMETL